MRPHRPPLTLLPCFAAFALAVVPARLVAQPAGPRRDEPPSFVNQQRLLQNELQERFEEELTALERVSFDFGGWYNLYFFQFDDGVNSSRTLRRHDLRLWTRITFGDGAQEIYARGRVSLLDFNHGDSFDGNEDDIEGMNLERGYYRFNLGRSPAGNALLPAQTDATIKLGRDLAVFGTGMTLAENLDQAHLILDWHDWRMTLLAGKSVGSTEDFDISRNATRNRRSFLGAEARYRGIDRHEPFAYALTERDRNSERPEDFDQEYDYDANYVGLGATGEAVPRLRYAVEGVYEWGHNYSDGRARRESDIEAWALLAELEYLFPGPTRPRASVEYLFGSGDADRPFSPVSTAGGNIGDFTDNGFIAFGFRDTGLSFAPRYSNLHMWRAGASCHPWPQHTHLSRIEVGTDWFLYHKHHREAAVSDPTANVASGYLGWEMDYFLNWQATADMFYTARLGVFFPGSAFSDQTTRTFLLLGVTWSF